MASYHIMVRKCVDGAQDLRVLLQDADKHDVGHLDALSVDHARMIARDLMALMRQRDPRGEFIVDTHVGQCGAA